MRAVLKAACWIIAVAVVCATLWLGYQRQAGEAPVVERPVPVEVEPVGVGAIEQTVELTGWIEANARVEVASKIAGRIESLSMAGPDGSRRPVEVGLAVGRGQKLAIIDHDTHRAQVVIAEAEVKTRQVQLDEAERERARVVGLFEKGSTPEQQKDKAVTAAELALAGLNLAQANLELARINLRESTIVSPIGGVVTAKHIDEGNLVSAGQRIACIADVSTVKVLVAVPERYGPQIREGLPVRICVDACRDRTFETRVYSIHPALDEHTHTIQAEIRLANDGLLFRPGMFARVALVLDRRENTIVVPRDIVLGGKIDPPYVYVVEQGIAKKRPVEIGLRQGDRCEVRSGLHAGENLVVNGMHYLADGIRADVVRLEDVQ